jgi:tetratricopeptide (TPR) repeat protein
MRTPAAPSALCCALCRVGACHSTVRRTLPKFRILLHANRMRNALASCIVLVSLAAHALPAQQSNSSGDATPGWPMHDSAPQHGLPDAVGTAPEKTHQNIGSCLLWTVAAAPANTVSAAALQIPGKARAECEKGCRDLRDGKFENAENHLRKAIQLYPKYADALVLLGQLLAAHKHVDNAFGLCSQASHVDPDFVPAYLCLADTSGQLREWNRTLEFADRALQLDPVQNIYGHFYLAVAQFHLSQFSGAEKNALQAIDDDHLHRLPQAHLLLAQIYGNRNDLKNVATQLRAYLQAAPKSPDAPDVRKKLEDIESRIPR